MSTYGDYSGKIIKKVCCSKCYTPIKNYNLQLLLDQDITLCPACELQYPGNNKRGVVPEEDPLDTLVMKRKQKTPGRKKAKKAKKK